MINYKFELTLLRVAHFTIYIVLNICKKYLTCFHNVYSVVFRAKKSQGYLEVFTLILF